MVQTNTCTLIVAGTTMNPIYPLFKIPHASVGKLSQVLLQIPCKAHISSKILYQIPNMGH